MDGQKKHKGVCFSVPKTAVPDDGKPLRALVLTKLSKSSRFEARDKILLSAIFFISKLAMGRIGRLVKELIQKGQLKLNVSYNNEIYNSIALIDFPATYPKLMAVNNPLPER